MKTLAEVLSALRENEARYAHEVETGTRKDGSPMTPERIAQRAISLERVRERIQIAEKWAKSRPRPDAFLTDAEREFIVDWSIDPDDLFAVVQR